MGNQRRGKNSTPHPEESPQALKLRLDETKNKADQLERWIGERDRLYASTMSREELAAWIEKEEEMFLQGTRGSPPAANKYLREEYDRRHAGERWHKEERPKKVAELQYLQEEHQRLEARFWQAVQQARQPARWSNKSAERVSDVKKVLEELSIAAQKIRIPEDYDSLRREHPEWLIFKAAKKWSELRELIIALPERKGRLVGFAQQIVAVIHPPVKRETVKYDWTHRPKAAPSKPSK